jgi:hypothetical protein
MRGSIALLSLAVVLPTAATSAAAPREGRVRDVRVAPPASRAAADPRTEALARLSLPVTLSVQDQPLRDVIGFLVQTTGAELDPVYVNDRTSSGLDPDWPVTLSVADTPALTVLERLLDKATSELDPPYPFTWQLTESGTVELGPQDRLARRKTAVIYDVRDMTFEVRDFDDPPEFDLTAVLQSGGSGSTSSPFSSTQTDDADRTTERERLDKIVEVLTSLIEPEAWEQNGGDFARVRTFQGQLIVTAPDFIHRQIAGYAFWPRSLQPVRRADGRRWTDVLPAPIPDRKP